jgi:hypothetical protein
MGLVDPVVNLGTLVNCSETTGFGVYESHPILGIRVYKVIFLDCHIGRRQAVCAETQRSTS